MTAPDLSPPWVLFSDHDKPIAILPAMRPGEVANVRHLTMKQAQRVVRAANKFYDVLIEAELDGLKNEIQKVSATILRNPNP